MTNANEFSRPPQGREQVVDAVFRAMQDFPVLAGRITRSQAEHIVSAALTSPAMSPTNGLRAANIILISQSMSMSGFETHGLFPTFETALAHVCKDEGLAQAAWAKTTHTTAEFVYRNTRWVASREPARTNLDGTGGGK